MLVKYPRTYHLPWSEGITTDDKVMLGVDAFYGKEVVVTEKMDGENTTLYPDYMHARSLDSPHNAATQSWVLNFWSSIRYKMPTYMDFRVCGENLYATHSIKYDNLPSYFMGFSAWVGELCLSWWQTMDWFEYLGIVTVPVLYRGVFDKDKILEAVAPIVQQPKRHEGYVIRLADEFTLSEFSSSVGKYVRAGHVKTTTHWRHQKLECNELSVG